ncbi:ATP-binding cassette domain-containing protein [Streptococcus sp. ZB199]|nr:ATP-binding cassette domain-containing protein [Streptococcus sp. ZB199]
MGPTGSGKTTLLRLLLREHDLEQGDILLNGISIKHYRLKDLRSLIGYVPQDQILFAMTIRENVAFSDPQIKEEEVIKALRTCGSMRMSWLCQTRWRLYLEREGSLFLAGKSNG